MENSLAFRKNSTVEIIFLNPNTIKSYDNGILMVNHEMPDRTAFTKNLGEVWKLNFQDSTIAVTYDGKNAKRKAKQVSLLFRDNVDTKILIMYTDEQGEEQYFVAKNMTEVVFLEDGKLQYSSDNRVEDNVAVFVE